MVKQIFFVFSKDSQSSEYGDDYEDEGLVDGDDHDYDEDAVIEKGGKDNITGNAHWLCIKPNDVIMDETVEQYDW